MMNIKIKFILVALICATISYAQDGSTVECFNCDGAIHAPLPTSGSWYNPEQSGTGYILEHQNGRLLGYYFGYDENGDPNWLIMIGDLERGEAESDVLWQVEAEFESFRGGNDFNAPHQTPVLERPGDTVKFEFTSKNYARVTVNDGPTQNFTTLIYGIGLAKEFEESDHIFPDLEGMWNFTFKVYRPPDFPFQNQLYSSDSYHLTRRDSYTEEGTKFIRYGIQQYISIEILPLGELLCSNQINVESNNREVICELTRFPFVILGGEYDLERMAVPIGDIGESSFTAEFIKPGDDFNGLTIDAKRINYIGLEQE